MKHTFRPNIIKIFISISVTLGFTIKTNAQYQPYTFDELMKPYIIYKAAYDVFKSQVEELMGQISDILAKDIDSEMRSSMNQRYRQADAILNKLTTHGLSKGIQGELDAVKRGVRYDIIAYNNRVAIKNEEVKRRQQQEEQRQMEEQRKPKNWTGSGFALKNRFVVTNNHVVEDAHKITIRGIDGNFNTSYSALVVASDKYNDLAVLEINDSRFTCFRPIPYGVKTADSEVGEDVFVLGYPLTATMGDEIKYTTGVISSRTGFQGDVSLYQISTPIQPGNSGCPLFNSKGNLIGIVSAKHTGAENVGYAIKSSYLKNLVDRSTSSSILPSSNSISYYSRPEQIKSIKDFVFIIECSTLNDKETRYSQRNSANGSVSGSSGMTISKNSISLAIGSSFKLYAYDYGPSLSWTSSDPTVATIDSQGVVRGVRAGSTSIWAEGNELKCCLVTVYSSSNSSSINGTSRKISGKISNIKGEAVAGVAIKIKESTLAVSDTNGQYSLTAKPGDRLVFACRGFYPEGRTVGGSSIIDVTLISR